MEMKKRYYTAASQPTTRRIRSFTIGIVIHKGNHVSLLTTLHT